MWQQRGDRVAFDEHPLEPEDFGEVGRVEIHDMTDRLAPDLSGLEVLEARIVESAAGEPNGLALLGPGGRSFCMWIADDALRWGDETALAAQGSPDGEGAKIGALLWKERATDQRR
jgi:hypothetical protein